jgi:hypothetical protein
MILVKLKVNTKPKERIAMVTQERAEQLINAHPNIYSLLEEKAKPSFEEKMKDAKENGTPEDSAFKKKMKEAKAETK